MKEKNTWDQIGTTQSQQNKSTQYRRNTKQKCTHSIKHRNRNMKPSVVSLVRFSYCFCVCVCVYFIPEKSVDSASTSSEQLPIESTLLSIMFKLLNKLQLLL